MIKEFYSRDRYHAFFDHEDMAKKNIYTVIVGKNGSGKSTLLGSLVWNLLAESRTKLINYEGDSEIFEAGRGSIKTKERPSQIIAVSTSPFDKFPLTRRLEAVKGYSYLGLRDLHSSNFGLAYLAKIISSLIQSVQERPAQADEIANVLNYLGYHETIRIRFNFEYTRKMLRDFLEVSDPIGEFEKRSMLTRRINRRFFYDENENLDPRKIRDFKKVAARLVDVPFNVDLHVEINRRGIEFDSTGHLFLNEFSFLVQSGLLRLKDVGVQRLADSSLFSIRNASSGEQSVILGFLGIASQIKNNALICIDEPEICLHPQWQEKYIQLLISTFSNYRGCQFIIATHSPQIISRLNDRNCFILSMEHGLLKDASEFIKNSADFQLARLFDSPGYKNEYLSRIAINIFSRVSRNKRFEDVDVEQLKMLEYQSNFLDKKDPVFDLYISLKQLLENYG